MLLNDIQIKEKDIIYPFHDSLIRNNAEFKCISYGLSSFGYDISLSHKEFKVFQHQPGEIVNPKSFDENFLKTVALRKNQYGYFFILPGLSYGLGFSNEHFEIPENVLGICTGKSTYARMGIIVNITPLEPGWNGYLTIEISNNSPSDCMIYAGEGIAQLLFFEGNRPLTTYSDRKGKYQNQKAEITLPKL